MNEERTACLADALHMIDLRTCEWLLDNTLELDSNRNLAMKSVPISYSMTGPKRGFSTTPSLDPSYQTRNQTESTA